MPHLLIMGLMWLAVGVLLMWNDIRTKQPCTTERIVVCVLFGPPILVLGFICWVINSINRGR